MSELAFDFVFKLLVKIELNDLEWSYYYDKIPCISFFNVLLFKNTILTIQLYGSNHWITIQRLMINLGKL